MSWGQIVGDVAAGLVLLVLPPVALWLITKVVQHSISLYGVRAVELDGTFAYRFGIQNREDIALKGPVEISINLNTADGHFLDDPQAFAGATEFKGNREKGGRSVTLRTGQMLGYDSWIIMCRTTGMARDVTLGIRSGVEKSFRVLKPSTGLKEREIRLRPRGESSAVGSARSPSLSIAILGIIVAVGLYLAPLVSNHRFWNLIPLSGVFGPVQWPDDVWITGGIVLGGLLMWGLTTRSAPPFVQGYRRPSKIHYLGGSDAREK